MTLTTYTVPKTDFPNSTVNPGQLFTEIEESSITTRLNNVVEHSDDVDIIFDNPLSNSEQTTLNNIIANYVQQINMNINEQDIHKMIGDNNIVLSVSELNQLIYICNPTTNRSITLPSAEDIVSTNNMITNESFEFSIINTSGTNTIQVITTTIFGNDIINTNSSGLFKLRITDSTVSSEAYTIYRIS